MSVAIYENEGRELTSAFRPLQTFSLLQCLFSHVVRFSPNIVEAPHRAPASRIRKV